MTHFELAYAIIAYLPRGVLEQILEIGKTRAHRHVEMEFKHGRCQEIKVTQSQRYHPEDFLDVDSVDNVMDKP